MFNDTKQWSLSLGQEGMVSVRLHMVVLLSLVALVGFATNHETTPSHAVGTMFATALICSFLVATFTIAHFAVICRSGGTIKSICFLPWGTIFEYGSATSIPARRQAYVMSMVTSLFLIFAGIFILSIGQPNPWSTAIHPFSSLGLDWKNVDRSFVELFTKLVISQFCLNLIPLAPFASGYFLETWLVPRADRHKNQVSASFLLAIGHSIAILFFVYAFFVRNQPSPFFRSETFLGVAWVAPVFAGIFISYLVQNRFQYLALSFAESNAYQKTSRHHRKRQVSHSSSIWNEGNSMEASYDRKNNFSNQTQSSSDSGEFEETPSPHDEPSEGKSDDRNKWEIWMEENHLSREDAQKLVEKTENDLLDQVLEKVNATGLKSLSIEERNLLERVSRRLRQK